MAIRPPINMKQLIAFIRKEFYHVFRDRRTLLILFGIPIAQIVLFGQALSSEVKNIGIAVLDEANNTYTFSHGLGIAIMSFGILTLLGIWFPKVGFVGSGLVIIMTFGTLSFLVTTPEVWVPDLGSGEHGFPLLTGAGRLVIKDVCILAGAVVVLADCAQRILKNKKR